MLGGIVEGGLFLALQVLISAKRFDAVGNVSRPWFDIFAEQNHISSSDLGPRLMDIH